MPVGDTREHLALRECGRAEDLCGAATNLTWDAGQPGRGIHQ